MQPMFPYPSRRFPALSSLQWLALAVAVCVIAFVSLGAHDLAITHLGVPYPEEGTVPG